MNLTFFNLNKNIASICAVLLGFSLAISTGSDSILLAIILLTALIGWHKQYLHIIHQNPVAKTALLLFGILIIGCFYGAVPPSGSLKVLTKYDDLILVALLLPIFSQAKLRTYGQYAFMTAMALTLILSYLIWLGLLHIPQRLPDNPVVFKLQITHGILMSFAAFVAAVYAVHTSGRVRWLMLLFSMLATFNVLLMTQGRTGYLTIIALAVYFMITLLSRRNLLLGIGLVIVASALTYVASPKIQSRVMLAIHEAQTWQPKQGHNVDSSIGTRMDYYNNTIKIIRKNPLLGVGTGGFETAYAKEIENTAMARSNNPHNQFLLFWAQTGIVGLLAFIFLLRTAWRAAMQLPSQTETMLARGVLITIIVGCLFNSLLLDHTEGLFFSWFSGLLFAGLPNHKQAE
ncbi:O-antigen ligase [mine drainage metagenome]|uniref:O-antigen ligase n=1 Tax=mine drainage metagenome TaxID=410659 RepID=A0A1J5S420_9ZZZZ